MEKILNILLNEPLVESLLLWQAIVAPLAGLVVGLIWGSIKQRTQQYTIRGFALGLMGPFILLLWVIYNSITDTLGLDTVKNLLTNLLLFIVTGLVLGFFYRYIFHKTDSPSGPREDKEQDSSCPESQL